MAVFKGHLLMKCSLSRLWWSSLSGPQARVRSEVREHVSKTYWFLAMEVLKPGTECLLGFLSGTFVYTEFHSSTMCVVPDMCGWPAVLRGLRQYVVAKETPQPAHRQ